MTRALPDLEVLRKTQLVMLKMLKQVDCICRKHHIKYWLDHGTLLGAVRHQGFIPWDDDTDICMLREDYEHFLKVAPAELSADTFLQNFLTEPDFTYPFTRLRDNNSLLIGVEEVGATVRYHQGIFIDILPAERLPRRKWVRYIWRRVIVRKIILACGFITKYRQRPVEPLFSGNWLRSLRTALVTNLLGGLSFPHNLLAAKIEQKLRRLAIVPPSEKGSFVIGYGLALALQKTHDYDEIFPLKELQFEGQNFYVPSNCDRYLRTLYGDAYMQPPPEQERVPHHAAFIIPDLKNARQQQ